MIRIPEKIKKVIETITELPLFIFVNLLSVFSKLKRKMIVSFEITTTNEFFYLKNVIEGLQNENALIVIMVSEKIKSSIKKLCKEHLSKKTVIVTSYWFNKFVYLDFYINATLSYDIKVPKNARYKINFPHTPTSKAKYDVFSEAIEKITDTFVPGDIYLKDQENFCNDFKIKNIPRVHKVGSPKYDDVFKVLENKPDKNKLLSELNLDPSLPTILYAPTWNQEASVPKWLEHVMKISEKEKINLLVKIHPGCYIDPKNKKSSGAVDWKTFFEDKNLHKKRIRNIYEKDSPEYIAISDIVITDISTLWVECYIFNRKIIFLDIPEFFEKLGMNSLGDFRNDFGWIVKNSNEMDSLIKELLQNTELKKSPPNIMDRLFYNKGKASEVVIDEIKKLFKYK